MASAKRIINPAPPNLPLGPQEYERRYQDQFSNVLRLYFNQLKNALGELFGDNGGRYIAFPNGAFYQDGYTTLTANMTNNGTTPIQVTSTANFFAPGGLIIGSEIITYTGKTATTFTGITRGAYGSTNVAHTAGVSVSEAQTLASSSTSTALTLLQTTVSNGVSIDPADKTKIVHSIAGIYNIQFSIQMLTFDGTIDNVTTRWRQLTHPEHHLCIQHLRPLL
jgi:hypothetical protein